MNQNEHNLNDGGLNVKTGEGSIDFDKFLNFVSNNELSEDDYFETSNSSTKPDAPKTDIKETPEKQVSKSTKILTEDESSELDLLSQFLPSTSKPQNKQKDLSEDKSTKEEIKNTEEISEDNSTYEEDYNVSNNENIEPSSESQSDYNEEATDNSQDNSYDENDNEDEYEYDNLVITELDLSKEESIVAEDPPKPKEEGPFSDVIDDGFNYGVAIVNKPFPVDHTKPFNRQQPKVLTNQHKINPNNIPTTHVEEPVELNIDPELPQEDRTKKEKELLKLRKKGYPKTYYDPTDEEMDENGIVNYYFNIEKTLRKNNLLWLTKIIPLDTLDNLTYDKPFFDNYAVKQHMKVSSFNQLSPELQYAEENKKKTLKILSGLVCFVGLSLYVMFGAIPNKKFDNAMELYQTEQWKESQMAFSNNGNFKGSQYYAKFSEAMTLLETQKFDDAKKCFSLLADYQSYFEPSIETLIKECDYQKAIKTYSSRNHIEAMKIFATIPDYKEARTYYYKSGYALAEEYYDSGDNYKAIDAFYRVRNFKEGDKDAQKELIQLASNLYGKALKLYQKNDFTEAIEIFTFLSKYNFNDSKSMISQCQYRAGLNAYNAGNYEEARLYFNNIPYFKDSNAMYKQCTYKLAKMKYAVSIEDSLKEYSKITTFRDVPSIMNQSVFNIFGEWEIVEINHLSCPVVKFKFDTGGFFRSEKEIGDDLVAISTPDRSIKYNWTGEYYEANVLGKKYALIPVINEKNQLEITCTNILENKSAVITCNRLANYNLMLLHNEALLNGEDPENANKPSESETMAALINKYLNIKGEDIIYIDKEKINCPLIIQQINDKIG